MGSNQLRRRVYLDVPYAEKDAAKALGHELGLRPFDIAQPGQAVNDLVIEGAAFRYTGAMRATDSANSDMLGHADRRCAVIF